MADPFDESYIGQLVGAFDRIARSDEWQSSDGYVSGVFYAAKADYITARATLIANLKEIQARLEYAEKDVACRQGNADHNYALLCEVRDQLVAKDTALKLCVEAMRAVSVGKFSNIKVRGREVGIEADDGEKCWAVHSDDMDALEGALASAEKAGGGNV